MRNSQRNYLTLSTCAKALTCALGHRDLHTQKHSFRVIELSVEIAEACGMTRDEIERLKISACFHDIGKIGIPDEILLKPGRLNKEEWTVMKTHSEKGEDIVKELDIEGSDQIAQTIRHHHEHFDGSGYPDGYAGESIPVSSRIISVADSYDAIAERRSYHKERTHKDVMDIIYSEASEKLDPYVVGKLGCIIKHSAHRAM